jgi:Domain of unknown function (DUF4192)
MTADPELPPITCPSSLVASCAPLLGFEPADCVVALVLGVPERSGPVLVRMDLGAPEGAAARARGLATSIAGTGGHSAELVAFVTAPDAIPRDDLPSAPLLDALGGALRDRGIAVAASISTNGSRWWSHGCHDRGCCLRSEPLDPAVLTQIRAEYAYAGFAPLPSRADLAARVAADPGRSSQVAAALLSGQPPTRVERWRDTQIAFLTELVVPPSQAGATGGTLSAGPGGLSGAGSSGPGTGHRVTVARTARAVRALRDVPVRDTLLLRLIRAEDGPPDGWRRTIEVLCEVVRAAPDGFVAPAATLLALTAWMRGDGALANAALDRAQSDDPAYHLADLARAVIARGMDPAVWRDGMSGLTEAECRRAGRPRSR